jgi:Rho GTPase-activating protein RGD1
MGGVYDKHASTQKKVARSTLDTIRGGERKHGQYAAVMEEGLRRLDTQADFFGQFALQCSQMHDELVEQVKTFEDRRKTEKQNGLTAEKRAQGAEEEMMKAKAKRDRLAEDLDRVKTGDRAGRGFGRLGTRSQAQQEEDLSRKLQAADQDYQAKTQNAQQVRQNLLQAERPATVHRLLTMIRELDAAVCLQYGYYGECFVGVGESS